ncbi:hypothetical protein CIHG_03147 [Coccidioides immitis H538.4]|uniref:Uncharacterized protein n=1 Tax=Coccidioides immitis H538.4 TaxID=396776 RepID=A0A0J8UDK3_COCIT|nr:hypothetical protein CIHG_03147 [Coccidioides immitis H538.4]
MSGSRIVDVITFKEMVIIHGSALSGTVYRSVIELEKIIVAGSGWMASGWPTAGHISVGCNGITAIPLWLKYVAAWKAGVKREEKGIDASRALLSVKLDSHCPSRRRALCGFVGVWAGYRGENCARKRLPE